jgi:hypothetical protein
MGTAMVAVEPLDSVTVNVVLRFVGRKQYPRSTQCNPDSAEYFAVKDDVEIELLVTIGVMRSVARPSVPRFSQSCFWVSINISIDLELADLTYIWKG